jgi:hypothetical protein
MKAIIKRSGQIAQGDILKMMLLNLRYDEPQFWFMLYLYLASLIR